MVHLKSARDIQKIRDSCRIAAEAMARTLEEVNPGVTTLKLDQVAEAYIRRQGGVPSAKGYKGYPKSICVSVNEVVVHGIPGDRVLEEGDILSVDIAVKKKGFHGDMNISVGVGQIAVEAQKLLDTTHQALEFGLRESQNNRRLGDIGHVIQNHVEAQGFSVVRDFCGHGIGRNFHEEPQLLHFGAAGTGLRLRPGMVFTIEPMVNQGEPGVEILGDNWTAVSRDRRLSAQFEHTVAVTQKEPDILSRFEDLPF